jgi:hypothetical protein
MTVEAPSPAADGTVRAFVVDNRCRIAKACCHSKPRKRRKLMKKLVAVIFVAFGTMMASPSWVHATDSTVSACQNDCKAKKKECLTTAGTDKAAKKTCKDDAKACAAACKQK